VKCERKERGGGEERGERGEREERGEKEEGGEGGEKEERREKEERGREEREEREEREGPRAWIFEENRIAYVPYALKNLLLLPKSRCPASPPPPLPPTPPHKVYIFIYRIYTEWARVIRRRDILGTY